LPKKAAGASSQQLSLLKSTPGSHQLPGRPEKRADEALTDFPGLYCIPLTKIGLWAVNVPEPGAEWAACFQRLDTLLFSSGLAFGA